MLEKFDTDEFLDDLEEDLDPDEPESYLDEAKGYYVKANSFIGKVREFNMPRLFGMNSQQSLIVSFLGIVMICMVVFLIGFLL